MVSGGQRVTSPTAVSFFLFFPALAFSGSFSTSMMSRMIDLASLSQNVSFIVCLFVNFFFVFEFGRFVFHCFLTFWQATTNSYPIITWWGLYVSVLHFICFVCNRQVSVVISTPQGTFLCGGSIISAGYILTAAHCMKDLSSGSVQNPANIIITPGISRPNTATQRGVQRFWVHSTYDASVNPSRRIDLGEEFWYFVSCFFYCCCFQAVLQLTTPLTLTSLVQPINMCSPTSGCGAPGGLFLGLFWIFASDTLFKQI